MVSCCGEADAYEADIFEVEGGHYVAVITDGKGEIPNGTKIPVPNNKIKWDEGNPKGTASSSSASKDSFIATLSLAVCDRMRGRRDAGACLLRRRVDHSYQERCEECSGRRRWDLVTQYFSDHIFLYRCGQKLPQKFSDAEISRHMHQAPARRWRVK